MNISQSQPLVYVIGDSISVHYGPYLKEMLEPHFCYDRKSGTSEAMKNLDIPAGANGGDSSAVLYYLRQKHTKEPNWKPDLLLLNCGLHDLKTYPATGNKQVPLEQYSLNLRQIVALMKSAGIKMAWVRTTQIDDQNHNSIATSFKRYSADVDRYNYIADEIMSDLNIPTADLCSMTKQLGISEFCDHAHFHEDVRRRQARYLADFIIELYQKHYFC